MIQTVRALREQHDAQSILAGGPSARWLSDEPVALVDEREFRDLVEAVAGRMNAGEARAVLYRAGALTAEYVLRNRIPRVAQTLIRVLRRGPGAAILLRAIGANAGTFGESGRYSFSAGRPVRVRIANPVLSETPDLALAVCAYNRGAFEGLFRDLIDRRSRILEESCQGHGDALCIYRFESEAPR